MVAHVHFASVVAWMVIAIAGLLWVISCGAAAGKMEKEGLAFWRGLLTCLLLSPLAGAAVIVIARMSRPSRRFVETVSRG
jgi:predicted anti-sigma-YlaC factor YlaD